MEQRKLKSFLYEKIAERAVGFGVFPEMEGSIVPSTPAAVRLRIGFRNFQAGPAADTEGYFTGDISLEILSVPGNLSLTGMLTDSFLKLFSPGNGELRNEDFRVLTTVATFSDHGSEGKYERSGLKIHAVVWENHEH